MVDRTARAKGADVTTTIEKRIEAPARTLRNNRSRWIALALALAAAIVASVVLVLINTGGSTSAPKVDARTASLQRFHEDNAIPIADPVTSALQRMHADAAKP